MPLTKILPVSALTKSRRGSCTAPGFPAPAVTSRVCLAGKHPDRPMNDIADSEIIFIPIGSPSNKGFAFVGFFNYMVLKNLVRRQTICPVSRTGNGGLRSVAERVAVSVEHNAFSPVAVLVSCHSPQGKPDATLQRNTAYYPADSSDPPSVRSASVYRKKRLS